MAIFELTLAHPETKENYRLTLSLTSRKKIFNRLLLPGLFYHLALPNGRIYFCSAASESPYVDNYTVAREFYRMLQWKQLGTLRYLLFRTRRSLLSDGVYKHASWLQFDATAFALRNAQYMPRLWLRGQERLVAIFSDGTVHVCKQLTP